MKFRIDSEKRYGRQFLILVGPSNLTYINPTIPYNFVYHCKQFYRSSQENPQSRQTLSGFLGFTKNASGQNNSIAEAGAACCIKLGLTLGIIVNSRWFLGDSNALFSSGNTI